MDKNRDGPVTLCLFALLFSIYLLTFSGIYHSSDEMSMLAATDSLARGCAWDIQLLQWMGEQQGSFGPDGLLYSRKGIGTTLAALPHYWVALHSAHLGNVQTAMLTNSAITALTGVLIFLFLRELRYALGVALGTALAYGLATMAWPYARYLFSEPLAGLGLMLSAYALLRYQQSFKPAPNQPTTLAPILDRQRTRDLLLAGTGLGIALLARLNNAIVALFLGLLLLYYLYRQFRVKWKAWIKPIILFGLPVLVALVVAGWYNWLRFGSPWTTGYLPEERFATPFFQGFYGLTFSPGKGLFWYNLILFAALVAWPFFLRRHRDEALLIAAVVLSSIAFYAPWYLWWAGHSWGPRFLVTMLPFALLPLVEALEAASRHRLLAIILGILVIASIVVQILGVVVDFNLYLEDVYAELGLYHPDTLFTVARSPLLRQITYFSPETLDLAWARGGSVDWWALLSSLGLVVVSGLSLWSAWRGRSHIWVGGGLWILLAVGTVFALLRYAPTGDMAQAMAALAAMEQPGEAGALTDLYLTESFQNTYDGRLWVWGVPSRHQVEAGQEATWEIGPGDPDPAAARFQVGGVRLDYYPPPGELFGSSRLPAEPLGEEVYLGTVIELLAAQQAETTAQPGDNLSLVLNWRALAPMDTSYTVFVHAVEENGTKAGQVDRVPCDGGCPTNTWQPGDLIGERYDLTIQIDAVPGYYQLITGMYSLETGETLPWSDAEGNDLGPHLNMGTIEVRP